MSESLGSKFQTGNSDIFAALQNYEEELKKSIASLSRYSPSRSPIAKQQYIKTSNGDSQQQSNISESQEASEINSSRFNSQSNFNSILSMDTTDSHEQENTTDEGENINLVDTKEFLNKMGKSKSTDYEYEYISYYEEEEIVEDDSKNSTEVIKINPKAAELLAPSPEKPTNGMFAQYNFNQTMSDNESNSDDENIPKASTNYVSIFSNMNQTMPEDFCMEDENIQFGNPKEDYQLIVDEISQKDEESSISLEDENDHKSAIRYSSQLDSFFSNSRTPEDAKNNHVNNEINTPKQNSLIQGSTSFLEPIAEENEEEIGRSSGKREEGSIISRTVDSILSSTFTESLVKCDNSIISESFTDNNEDHNSEINENGQKEFAESPIKANNKEKIVSPQKDFPSSIISESFSHTSSIRKVNSNSFDSDFASDSPLKGDSSGSNDNNFNQESFDFSHTGEILSIEDNASDQSETSMTDKKIKIDGTAIKNKNTDEGEINSEINSSRLGSGRPDDTSDILSESFSDHSNNDEQSGTNPLPTSVGNSIMSIGSSDSISASTVPQILSAIPSQPGFSLNESSGILSDFSHGIPDKPKDESDGFESTATDITNNEVESNDFVSEGNSNIKKESGLESSSSDFVSESCSVKSNLSKTDKTDENDFVSENKSNLTIKSDEDDYRKISNLESDFVSESSFKATPNEDEMSEDFDDFISESSNKTGTETKHRSKEESTFISTMGAEKSSDKEDDFISSSKSDLDDFIIEEKSTEKTEFESEFTSTLNSKNENTDFESGNSSDDFVIEKKTDSDNFENDSESISKNQSDSDDFVIEEKTDSDNFENDSESISKNQSDSDDFVIEEKSERTLETENDFVSEVKSERTQDSGFSSTIQSERGETKSDSDFISEIKSSVTETNNDSFEDTTDFISEQPTQSEFVSEINSSSKDFVSEINSEKESEYSFISSERTSYVSEFVSKSERIETDSEDFVSEMKSDLSEYVSAKNDYSEFISEIKSDQNVETESDFVSEFTSERTNNESEFVSELVSESKSETTEFISEIRSEKTNNDSTEFDDFVSEIRSENTNDNDFESTFISGEESASKISKSTDFSVSLTDSFSSHQSSAIIKSPPKRRHLKALPSSKTSATKAKGDLIRSPPKKMHRINHIREEIPERHAPKRINIERLKSQKERLKKQKEAESNAKVIKASRGVEVGEDEQIRKKINPKPSLTEIEVLDSFEVVNQDRTPKEKRKRHHRHHHHDDQSEEEMIPCIPSVFLRRLTKEKRSISSPTKPSVRRSGLSISTPFQVDLAVESSEEVTPSDISVSSIEAERNPTVSDMKEPQIQSSRRIKLSFTRSNDYIPPSAQVTQSSHLNMVSKRMRYSQMPLGHIDENYLNTIQSAKLSLASIKISINNSRQMRALKESHISTWKYTPNPFH